MDVIVITGPINRAQAGVPADVKVIDVQLGSGQVRSFHYDEAMQNFLAGRSLRKAVEAKVGSAVTKLGVLWFSAGHGAINRALMTSEPSDADVWLCYDGLYAGWKHQTQWATRLASAAAAGQTVCVATASTTTPGQYADGLTSWRNVMVPLGLPKVEPPVALEGFPPPAEMWAQGQFALMGYPDIPHWKQTPAVRDGMMNVWSQGALGAPPVPRPPDPPGEDRPPPLIPGDIDESTPAPPSILPWVGGIALVAGLAAWAAWGGRKR